MTARQYHVKLNGKGYMLEEVGGGLQYDESSPNPLAIKTSQGDAEQGDMSHLSHYIQADWRGGRGKDVAEDSSRFADAGGLFTHYQEQVSLRPRAQLVGMQTDGRHLLTIVDFNDPYYTSASTWKRGQSFQFTAQKAVNTVNLMLRTRTSGILPDATFTCTVRLETDSSGEPSGSLVHANATSEASVDLTPLNEWIQFDLDGSVTIAATTTYWIVLSFSGTPDADLLWASNGDQNSSDLYTSGTAATNLGSGWSDDTKVDCGFMFEERGDLPSHPVKALVFNDILYLAAGQGIYKITSGVWAGVKVNFADAITDMDILDDVLWISTGSGNNCWTMSTVEGFTEKTGVTGQLLYKFGGYLYRANGDDVYYTSNGTDWTTVTPGMGDSNTDINGMCGLEETIYIGKPEGLFALAPGDYTVTIERWDSQEDDNNGTGMVEWNGSIYIPVKYGLIRYNGQDFEPVGPDKEEGLPKLRMGKIVSMVPLLNYLVVAVDASGSTEFGSVLLYNEFGWHEVGRSWRAGARVRMVAYDHSNTPQRLYYGVANQAAYIEFSDDADNPKTWEPTAFEPSGYLETPWINGGLQDVWKVLSDIWVNMNQIGDGALLQGSGSAHQYFGIEVDYQVDQSGFWVDLTTAVGTDDSIAVLSGDSITLKYATTFTATTVASIVATVVTPTAGTPVKGSWYRVANESRQAKSVATNAMTPTVPYDNAAVADVFDDGYPSGREVKFRFRFYTQDVDTSPLMKALRFRWANQLTAWRQYSFVIRCEDNITLIDLSEETRTAKQLHDELQKLASEGNQLIVLNDLYENDRTVQLTDLKLPNTEFSYNVPGETTSASWRALLNLVEV